LHGHDCACPESLAGWIVYPDSASGAPDFFTKSSVQIQEVVLCKHSVHFLFRAKQAGRTCQACVVIAERTLEQSLCRLPADSIPNDADLEQIVQRLEWEQSVFDERMKSLRNILGQPTRGNHRARYKTGWLRNPPKLYLGPPFAIRYKGQSVELFGVPDVYFRGAAAE
jgi:hypothetical protein